ncbi:sensor histidine kinase [Paenibacillus montanisoli]|uniref:Two-component sensor histidine kinase n=1 Tax=Paenibacillus montanisoli TaxID=2081970 RepID=A0A328U2Y6_9BACL|nr:histidine kinase [Paenibacillus montanisoli]RAP77158.1 two-component sensor histidine kinase [Paenibacillus montanisoli]
MLKLSIKTQLIISFFVVMLPVVLFLVANTLYAKNVVRDKVSETYRNTLDIFAEKTDRSLSEVSNYLNKMGVLDFDVGLLSSFPYGSDNYVLTKIRIQNKLQRDIVFYNPVDTLFVYSGQDIFFSTTGSYAVMNHVLNDNLDGIIKSNKASAQGRWLLWYDARVPGGDFLVKVTQVPDSNVYVGSIIRISELLNQLAIQWKDGKIGESAIYRKDGMRLGVPTKWDHFAAADNETPPQNAELYQFVKDKQTGKRFLRVDRPSGQADFTINILVPESYMLQGLPYFQKATYILNFGLLFIFALYLFFIRHMLFKPLQLLIAGMKKLSLGMLDVRLQTNETLEFVFLANTFNNMAEQIKSLRIGVYEEQLRVQKIELKQLQAQINPHFYMNSLNIIYNFAALKDTDSVKKMSLHLADYFRFIMRVNRDLITLDEELRHIRNYMDIQKFRFPNKLDCVCDMPNKLKSIPLPALTIQPFVENAIIHGFVNHRQPFKITVRGSLLHEQGDAFLLIAIEDTGIGFTEDVMRRLNEGEGLMSVETSRLGILNVIQRLKLRYDGRADIRFYNVTENGGAGVRIQLPLAEEHGQIEEEIV